jgi:excisionase family DNA binding protein
MYHARCECGESLVVSGYWLKRTADAAACRHCMKHGNYKATALYRIWEGLRSRCFNERDPWHTVYRTLHWKAGVSMCPEWRRNFAAFRRDVGQRPAGTVIDRRDRTKGWTKDNTVWLTAKQFFAANEAECTTNSLRSVPGPCSEASSVMHAVQAQSANVENEPVVINRPLTSRDVAAMLGVSHKTVERHAREGTIPGHFRLNRCLFFQSELDEWLKAGGTFGLPTLPCELGGT